MSTGRAAHRPRRLALLAAAGLLAVPAAAFGSPSDRLVVEDRSGDAGAVNDRGEGLVGDVQGPVTFVSADLTRMAFTAVRDGEQPSTGFNVYFTAVGELRPTTSADGATMSYAVVMQPTPDCRLTIAYTVTQDAPGTAELQTGNGCSTPYEVFPLASTTWGTSVRIEVPYGVGPDALQPGEDLDQFYAYSSDGVVTYDTIYPRASYTLPR